MRECTYSAGCLSAGVRSLNFSMSNSCSSNPSKSRASHRHLTPDQMNRAATETLLSKLWRYAFFGWLLTPPSGDVFASHAQMRNNRRALKRWLPHS